MTTETTKNCSCKGLTNNNNNKNKTKQNKNNNTNKNKKQKTKNKKQKTKTKQNKTVAVMTARQLSLQFLCPIPHILQMAAHGPNPARGELKSPPRPGTV